MKQKIIEVGGTNALSRYLVAYPEWEAVSICASTHPDTLGNYVVILNFRAEGRNAE